MDEEAGSDLVLHHGFSLGNWFFDLYIGTNGLLALLESHKLGPFYIPPIHWTKKLCRPFHQG
jgi:hypothetical protein